MHKTTISQKGRHGLITFPTDIIGLPGIDKFDFFLREARREFSEILRRLAAFSKNYQRVAVSFSVEAFMIGVPLFFSGLSAA